MGTIGSGRNSINTATRTTTTTPTATATPAAKPAAAVTAKPANQVKDGFDARATNSAVRTAAPTGVFTAPAGSKDKVFDGKLVGKGGQAFDASTPLSQVPAYEPKGGVKTPGTIIYVNGMMTDKAGQEATLQAIADKTGQKTIGIHNSTEGFFKDLGQCITDKMDKGKNPAVDTLADSLYNELKAGRDVSLMAHSQGGLITSRALSDVAKRLRIEDGLSPRRCRRSWARSPWRPSAPRRPPTRTAPSTSTTSTTRTPCRASSAWAPAARAPWTSSATPARTRRSTTSPRRASSPARTTSTTPT